MVVDRLLLATNLIRTNFREWLMIFFHSFWGIFGWFSIYLPLWVYSILRKVTLFLILPFALFMITFWKKASSVQKRSLGILLLFFVLVFSAIIKDNLTFFHPQGRYLFSMIGIVGFYYTVALYEIARLLSRAFRSKNRVLIFYFILFVPLLFLNGISLKVINKYFCSLGR